VTALRDGWHEATPGPPGWRVWISASGRWWAIRRQPMTAAQIAAGALPLLDAATGTSLAARIRQQDHLHTVQPARPQAPGPASGLPHRQPRAGPAR
jgi:hypothetical protein